jgi:threonine dehydrogenase-like Zn-dependent dehydrogenase
MADAVAMLAEGKIDVEPLITSEYPLNAAPAALAAAAEPDSIKVLVRP